MRWSSRNLPADVAAAKEKFPHQAASVQSVRRTGSAARRTEILVERKVCTIEVHGVAGLEQCTHCPVCGQTLLELGKGNTDTGGTQ